MYLAIKFKHFQLPNAYDSEGQVCVSDITINLVTHMLLACSRLHSQCPRVQLFHIQHNNWADVPKETRK